MCKNDKPKFIITDMLTDKHYCIEDNYYNNGNVFQTTFQISSALMCQFECQNIKGISFNCLDFYIY